MVQWRLFQVRRFFIASDQQNKGLSSLIIASILLVLYCFLLSDSGLVARIQLDNDREHVQTRIQNLGEQRKELTKLMGQYRRGEFLREEALKSGYISSNERFLIFKGADNDLSKSHAPRESQAYDIELVHLKILWIILSLIILMFYIIRKKRYNTG